MHNEMQFGPRGNLGLAVKGVELYLPLSPTTCLAMYCPEMAAQLERKYQELQSCRKFIAQTRSTAMKDSIEKLFTAFRTGELAPMDSSNVEFVNSLQVWNAERYVFSAHDDFELAKDMLAKNSRLKFGPRFSVQ